MVFYFLFEANVVFCIIAAVFRSINRTVDLHWLGLVFIIQPCFVVVVVVCFVDFCSN